MVSGDDRTPRRSGNKRHAPVPANRRYNTSGHVGGEHQSSEDKHKSVPGLVSDPNDRLNDIERAIERGQQESMQRAQGHTYPGKKTNNNNPPSPGYRSSPPTITQPYYRPSLFRKSQQNPKKSSINPGFLSFLPGLAGCALLITAIVLTDWSVFAKADSSGLVITYQGLFRVCRKTLNQNPAQENLTCEGVNAFQHSNPVTSRLQQATRSLVIIAALIACMSVVVSFFFGISKWERKMGSVISGFLFLLAGAIAGGAMGCFTAAILDSIYIPPEETAVFVGSSFYFGWAGTGCLVVASITSFEAHCARRK